jgi:hypothetical protein
VRGNILLSHKPLPTQNPRSPRTSPLGLTSLNRKNLPIEVTVVGLVQLRQFDLLSSVYYPNYKLRDDILASLSRITKAILLKTTLFGKPCL